MRNTHILVVFAALFFVTNALASRADIFTRKINPAKNLLVFPNKNGEVVFSHLKHLKALSEDQCILCHRIENPTLESIQSRFDEHRIAHAFCKGCHNKMGRGPTECHLCHNKKKIDER